MSRLNWQPVSFFKFERHKLTITSKGVRVYTVARETASSEQVVHARLIIYSEKKM